ncbi:hypothetical protein Q5752_004157 [Cryptotrichosporon argae]
MLATPSPTLHLPSHSTSNDILLRALSAGPSRPHPFIGRRRQRASRPSTSTPTPPATANRTAVHARAVRHALSGRRAPGEDLAQDVVDRSDDEAQEDDKRMSIDQFGHRFLLPFGQRFTQMDRENAPTPDPSEPDPEHRQEDRNGIAPDFSAGADETMGSDDGGEAAAGDEVDLDASVEDRDEGMDGDGDDGDGDGTDGEGEDGDAEAEEVDLDASLEDRDANSRDFDNMSFE